MTLDSGTTIHRELRTEDGYMTQHSTTLVIGIGPEARVQSITVRWPSGRVQKHSGARSGTLVTVHENPERAPSDKAFAVENYR